MKCPRLSKKLFFQLEDTYTMFQNAEISTTFRDLKNPYYFFSSSTPKTSCRRSNSAHHVLKHFFALYSSPKKDCYAVKFIQ